MIRRRVAGIAAHSRSMPNALKVRVRNGEQAITE
jgi:hypothetical protein